MHIQILESSDFFKQSKKCRKFVFSESILMSLPQRWLWLLQAGRFILSLSPIISSAHFQGKFFVTKIEVLTKLLNSNSLSTSKLELQCKGALPFRNSFSSFIPSVIYSVWFGISNPLWGLSISQTSELLMCSVKRAGKTWSWNLDWKV